MRHGTFSANTGCSRRNRRVCAGRFGSRASISDI
jgi:hypothetical protein